MIAQTSGDTGESPPVQSLAPDYWAPVYAAEGHPANTASVTPAPPPPAVVPSVPGVTVLDVMSALVPVPKVVAPVVAKLTDPTDDVQGLLFAGTYRPASPASGSTSTPPAPMASTSGGTSSTATGGDFGVGDAISQIFGGKPAAAAAGSSTAGGTATAPQLTPRALLIGAVVLILLLR